MILSDGREFKRFDHFIFRWEDLMLQRYLRFILGELNNESQNTKTIQSSLMPLVMQSYIFT